MYDASAAGALLGPHAPLLARELAIIASKVSALRSIPFHQPNYFILSTQLGDALEALSLLVRTVHDHTSNGSVIPPRAAAQITERAGLAAWPQPSPTATTPDAPTAADNIETKRLLHLLLTIYTVYTTKSFNDFLAPIQSSNPLHIRVAAALVITSGSLTRRGTEKGTRPANQGRPLQGPSCTSAQNSWSANQTTGCRGSR